MANMGVFTTRKTSLGFVGVYSLIETGRNGQLIWSRSTEIHRLTRRDALLDAKREWLSLGGPMNPIKQHTEDCLDANDDTSVFKGECICPKEGK